MDRFLMGPLTIILKNKAGTLSTKVTAGLPTVGIRMPDHPIALAIIEASGVPIAAPSANISGKPSPTRFEHVCKDLYGKVAGIVDGGETGVGVESTVIDCTGSIPVILRPGGVTKEEIEETIGPVKMDRQIKEAVERPKSPGMKYTHYAPDAPVLLVEGRPDFVQDVINRHRQSGKKVGVLTTDEHKHLYGADVVISLGSRARLSTVARNLFSALRAFNGHQVDLIISETFPREGIGEAIMNRLIKAAGHRLIREEKC